MLDYLKRFLIAGIMAVCVSLLFFGGKPQANSMDRQGDWIWPADGIISDTFGTRFGHHKGIDIAGSLNNPIFSVDEGKVSKSYYSDTYGHVVFIKHKNNLETVYAHLNKRMVEEGQQVKKGEIIGHMGNTGNSNGVHLHFEVHQNEWTFEKENAFNPSLVFGNFEVGNVVQAIEDENAQYVLKNIPQDTVSDKNADVHIVSAGETLWSIAQKYSTTIEVIQSLNTLSTSDIFENQKLIVPKNNTYIVKDGDTLSAISQKTKLTVEEIKQFNKLQSDDIYPAQIINIPQK